MLTNLCMLTFIDRSCCSSSLFSAGFTVSAVSCIRRCLFRPSQPTDVVQFWHKGDSGLLETFLADTPTTNKAILSAYTSYYLDCGTGTLV